MALQEKWLGLPPISLGYQNLTTLGASLCVTNLCILTGSRAASNIITNRARALTARRADRRVDARLTTKSISQLPADIRNGSSVSELLLEHAARALCYTWRSGPFFGLVNYRVTDVKSTGAYILMHSSSSM